MQAKNDFTHHKQISNWPLLQAEEPSFSSWIFNLIHSLLNPFQLIISAPSLELHFVKYGYQIWAVLE